MEPRVQRRKAMGKVTPKFVPLEFLALARVMEHWARQSSVNREKFNPADRLPAFRAAMVSGMGRGIRATVPMEIIASDLTYLRLVIPQIRERFRMERPKHLREWLVQLRVDLTRPSQRSRPLLRDEIDYGTRVW